MYGFYFFFKLLYFRDKSVRNNKILSDISKLNKHKVDGNNSTVFWSSLLHIILLLFYNAKLTVISFIFQIPPPYHVKFYLDVSRFKLIPFLFIFLNEGRESRGSVWEFAFFTLAQLKKKQRYNCVI